MIHDFQFTENYYEFYQQPPNILMLSIANLTILYGPKQLFKDISVRVHPQDRIGLVGVNGTGKSTLLKILAGLQDIDASVRMVGKNATIGYLPQEITSFPKGRTLYEEAETTFADLLTMQQELEDIHSRISNLAENHPDFNRLLQRQGELQHNLDRHDVFRIRSRIEKVLIGLGFSEADFSRDCQTFSGGWLMRLLLAKHLLAMPDYLLLDEPTNHLDLDSLTWLEEFLQNYSGALIIISHDRVFLDNITRTTWELSLGNLTVYRGNYSKYIQEKALRQEIQRSSYANQQAKIQQTMRFVQRFRSKSTKASQVQSRLKQLEKMDIIEIEDNEQNIHFTFPPAPPSGKSVLEVKNLVKSFDGSEVFSNLSFGLLRGDKLAIVGVNGAGKSTLVKILARELAMTSGEIHYGHNVIASYFGQHQAQELNQEMTVMEIMMQTETDKTYGQLRSLLGAFLFRNEDVDKKVAVLSGGEKSRLALAKMIASPANVLIMDEPTNHLDMLSQDILRRAMNEFDGTLIVVSHNRYFLDGFVNKVLAIKDRHGTIYPGSIDYYLEKCTREKAAASPQSNRHDPQPASDSGSAANRGKAARQQAAKIRQLKSSRLSPLSRQNKTIETEIEKLEIQKTQLEETLAAPELYQDINAFADKTKEYSSVAGRLARAYQEWEKIQQKIDEIETEFKTHLTAD